MKNGKYSNGKKSLIMKPLAVLLALTLLVGCAVGGTIAWLTATTGEVENTFTIGNINIKLEETKKDFKMVPGFTIDKDPVVTVLSGSEDCWVFIEVTEQGNLDNFITYGIDSNTWTKLNGTAANNAEGVYYCKVTGALNQDVPVKVLGFSVGDKTYSQQVLVKDTVTKEMMDGLKVSGVTQPSLSFKAYAVQLYSSNGVEFEPAEAWAVAKPTTTP